MNPKRIACISYHTCPLSAQEGKETGGMNVYVFELMKQLSSLGYTIDIYTRVQDAKAQKIVQINNTLRVIHVIAGQTGNTPKRALAEYIPEFVRNIKQFIQENSLEYDLFDCHYYLSGLIGLEIVTKNTPLFMTFHTLALLKNMVAKSQDEIEPQERIEAEQLLVQKATKIISPTEIDKEYLQFLYNGNPNKITVISPGVDTDIFKPIEKSRAREFIGFRKNDKLILFAGRIEPLKGIDVLFYALKILLKKNPNLPVCLWIVGGDTSKEIAFWPKELKRLEALRKTLHIKSSVKFVGRKLPSELPYYYNSAEIVVMPSQYESFGMTALEAMSCGTPVITTDVTGIANIFDQKHAPLITSANNPLQLADYMENLLTHEEIREKIGKDARTNVLDLDWKNVASCMSDILQAA